jgi:hypothetical protein
MEKEKKLKLPYVGVNTLEKIIHSYSFFNGQAASLQDVASKASVHPDIVSRGNRFLESANIVSGGNAKKLLDSGKNLAMAIALNDKEDIGKNWALALSKLTVIQDILQTIEISPPTKDKLLPLIQKKFDLTHPSKYDNTGMNAVSELLFSSGLLTIKDGKVVNNKLSTTENTTIHKQENEQLQNGSSLKDLEPLELHRSANNNKSFQNQPSLHIDLQIHISPESSPEQIEQIFASMAKHLYGNK